MLQSKNKGLFVEFSEFSVLAARTNGFKLPMEIQAIAEHPLDRKAEHESVKAFLDDFAGTKDGTYTIARCGVYPEGRFIRLYEAESANKVKDRGHLTEVLKNEFNVDPETHVVSLLDARDGSDLVLEKAVAKKVVFCGAPTSGLQSAQDGLLEKGLYPERMEISTATTLGGVCDYARFHSINAPVLVLELTSKSTNIFIQNGGQVQVTRPVPFGLDSIYPLLQRELGLKDEASARKLFFSNTFDFAEMGPKLLRRIVKELQASTGFYEVQTGQTIDRMFMSVLPANLGWIGQAFADALGVEIMQPSVESWLESLNVKAADGVELARLGSRWMGLFSMMGAFHLRQEVADGQK